MGMQRDYVLIEMAEGGFAAPSLLSARSSYHMLMSVGEGLKLKQSWI